MAQSKDLPEYPNLGATVGGSVPVVTTLLAAISTATFLVPMEGEFNSGDMFPGSPDWESADMVLVFGISSTLCLVAATLAMVYAHAKDFDLIPTEKQRELFDEAGIGTVEEKTIHKESFRASSRYWYDHGHLLWLVGVVLLALSISALVFDYVVWLTAALSIGGTVLSVGLARLPLPWARVTGGALAVVSAVIVVCALISWFG